MTDAAAVKVTVALPPRNYSELRQRANQAGISMTELVRRALALYGLLLDDPTVEVILRRGAQDTKVVIA